MKNNITLILKAQNNRTQLSLAKEIGMTPPYLNRVISGGTVPTLPTAHKISSALGLKIEDVFTFNNEGPGRL